MSHFGHILRDWAVKLDPIILTGKVTNEMTKEMTNYSTHK